MAKLIDLTGQRIGKLVVLERDTSKKGVYWICKCDCGNIISTRGDTLRPPRSRSSCGCDLAERNSKAHLKDETGKVYGYLTVLKRIESINAQARWLCQCKCGNLTEVSGASLRNGSVQSCGCKRHEGNNGIDMEIGFKSGKLTVIGRAPNRPNNSHRYWLCQCECGNVISVQGTYLRKGTARHCGCESSAGEQKITSLLQNNQIEFIKQYTFEDLRNDSSARLRYDFGVLDKNTKELKYLIEYDGIQHFYDGFFGNTLEDLKKIQDNDRKKDKYCLDKGIPLIRISYEVFENLELNDILLETSKFIVVKERG